MIPQLLSIFSHNSKIQSTAGRSSPVSERQGCAGSIPHESHADGFLHLHNKRPLSGFLLWRWGESNPRAGIRDTQVYAHSRICVLKQYLENHTKRYYSSLMCFGERARRSPSYLHSMY